MELILLKDILIIFILSTVVVYLFYRLNLPAIIGFLMTGILAGPFGLGLVESVHEVEILAEIGILLLLFTIGIEFSFQEILSLKRSVLIGGGLQVGLTIIATLILGTLFFTSEFNELIFFGFLVTLSSTAIIIKLYTDRSELNTPHGRTALAVLIFQDIIVVPMILFTPILAGESGDPVSAILILFLKAAAIIVFVIVSTKYLVPNILYQITQTKSRELFLLTIFVICFGIVALTYWLGLSLALGAFIAGLIISESEYSHQALSNIMPIRDAFTSLFFVSIGMLLNFDFVLSNLVWILSGTVGVILLKSLIAIPVIMLLGFPLRTAILSGLALGQIGEFSFILAKSGIEFGFFEDDLYQKFLGVSIFTMALTPLLIKAAPAFANSLIKIIPDYREKKIVPDEKEDHQLNDHLVIIGFGINGKNIAHAARTANIPYIIIEMNPATVRKELSSGENIFYGDATNDTILKFAGINTARVAVIAINDPTATKRILKSVKDINQNIYAVVRTRFVREVEQLQRLGADEVIPEEFETSIEIFIRVMNKYLIPQNKIEELVDEIRSDEYRMLRKFPDYSSLTPAPSPTNFPGLEFCTFSVENKSKIIGKSLNRLSLRKKFNASVIAIKRGERLITNPNAETRILEDDMVFIFTEHKKIGKIAELFSSGETE